MLKDRLYIGVAPDTEKGTKPEKERTVEIFDHLLTLAEHPEKRDARVIALSEPILDVFYQIDGYKKGRESAAQEAVVSKGPELNLGGGTNVVRGLAPFSDQVTLITRVGTIPPFNHEMTELIHMLPDNVSKHIVADDNAGNSVKIRYQNTDGEVVIPISHHPVPISPEAEQQIVRKMQQTAENLRGNEKIVVSDYGRGLCSPNILGSLESIYGTNLPIAIDPRPGSDAHKYNVPGAMLKPNRDEAQQLSGITIDGHEDPLRFYASAHAATNRIMQRFPSIGSVLLTCDKEGSIFHSRHDQRPLHTPLPIQFGDAINPSGAGDIVIATLTLLQDKSQFSKQDRIRSAMLLASNSVTEPGTSTLSPRLVEETRDKYRRSI